MGERVSSRIAMYTIKQIRYIGMEDKDEHVITVQENKKIYKVKGTVKRIMKEKNGKRRSK
jgi:acyl-CoA hydrolase